MTEEEQLKEIRKNLKIIREERRELLKEYIYWKRKENKLKEQLLKIRDMNKEI